MDLNNVFNSRRLDFSCGGGFRDGGDGDGGGVRVSSVGSLLHAFLSA